MSLRRQNMSPEEKTKLRAAIGASSPLVEVADFSPGPWWGFNGIVTLALTSDQLYIARRRSWAEGHKLRRIYAISEIASVSYEASEEKASVKATLKLNSSRTRLFVSKYHEAENLLKALDGAISGANNPS